eukprot:640387-Pleurochrysis_carterae.AAC.1
MAPISQFNPACPIYTDGITPLEWQRYRYYYRYRNRTNRYRFITRREVLYLKPSQRAAPFGTHAQFPTLDLRRMRTCGALRLPLPKFWITVARMADSA